MSIIAAGPAAAAEEATRTALGGAGGESTVNMNSFLGALMYSLSVNDKKVATISGDDSIPELSKFSTSEAVPLSIRDLIAMHYHKEGGIKGGFSKVFYYPNESNPVYVLKLLNRRGYSAEQYKVETLIELKNLKEFSGTPYVNQVLGAEIYQNTGMIVLEYVKGNTLWDWMLTKNPNDDQKRQRFDEIRHALEKIHEKGFVHLDINSKNIWIPDLKSKPAFFLDLAALTPIGMERIVKSRTEGYSPGFLSSINTTHGNPEINAFSMSEVSQNIFNDKIPKRIQAIREAKERAKRQLEVAEKRRQEAAAARAAAASATSVSGSSGGARKSRRRSHSKKRRTFRRRH